MWVDRFGCWIWGHVIPLDDGGPGTSYGSCIHCEKKFSPCEWFFLQRKFKGRGYHINISTKR